MSGADILTQPNQSSSLSRFVLDVINGVIEGDARASRERVRAYQAYLEAINLSEDATTGQVAAAIHEAVDAGLLPPPLRYGGTVVVGRFAAQTEWRTDASGELTIGVGAVSLNVGARASYARQQSEASEFTITLEPTGEALFTALAQIHADTNKQAALPEPPRGSE